MFRPLGRFPDDDRPEAESPRTMRVRQSSSRRWRNRRASVNPFSASPRRQHRAQMVQVGARKIGLRAGARPPATRRP